MKVVMDYVCLPEDNEVINEVNKNNKKCLEVYRATYNHTQNWADKEYYRGHLGWYKVTIFLYRLYLIFVVHEQLGKL